MTAKPEQPEETKTPRPKQGAEPAGSEAPAEQSDAEDTVEKVDSELLDLQFALGEAERELAEHREAMLRMQAEMENLRKRLIRDLERSRRFALEQFMNDLLPVRDSLERGLQADDETATVETMKEGKALIMKMLGKVMEDHGLQLVNPLGESFDPELHEAVTMQPSDEYEQNQVMEVLQKGFLLRERLIRPAMVIVSQGPESA